MLPMDEVSKQVSGVAPKTSAETPEEKAFAHRCALALATELWGELAYAWSPDKDHDYYEVGRFKDARKLTVEMISGKGSSYQAAFLAAEGKEKS